MTKSTQEARREYQRNYKRKLRADPKHKETQYPDAAKNYQRKLKTVISVKKQETECAEWRDKIQAIADYHGLDSQWAAVSLAIEKEFKRCVK